MSDERDQAGGHTTSRASTIGAFTIETEPVGPGLRHPDARSRTPRAVRPFRHREYRLLVASGSASLLADGLWLVALVWQVIGTGGSPSDLSAVAAATSLGLVMAVLLGGVAADRFPKRAVLIGVEVVRTAVPVAHRRPRPRRAGCSCGSSRRWRSSSARRVASTTPRGRRSSRSCSPPTSCSPRTASRGCCARSPSRRPVRRSPGCWLPRSPRRSPCSGPGWCTWSRCCR